MTAVFTILLVLVQHGGQVLFSGVPVPGATVTVTQNDKKFVTITDQQGAYSFPDLADGPFVVQVEMLGFSTTKQEVNAAKAEIELKMLPISEIQSEIVRAAPPEPPATPTPGTAAVAAANSRQPAAQNRPGTPAFQRTEVNAAANANATPANNAPAPAQSSSFANASAEELSQRAADGVLINGTTNNGAASPFAQLQAFGNNRRSRPLYTGGANVNIDNSALNARSFSLTGQDTAQPAYNRFTGAFNIGGPMRGPFIPRNNAPNFFIGYQRVQNRNANTATGRMPTALERNGDFTQSTNLLGQPIQVFDPSTPIDPLTGKRQPFAGNVIPSGRISDQARNLMTLFPLPNFTDPKAPYNYQIPLIDSTHSDGIQSRVNKTVNPKNQFVVSADAQTSRSDSTNLFGFLNSRRNVGMNFSFQWTNRPTARFNQTFRYQFGRQTARVTPYFANKINVSGAAGVTGNNQEAVNWGTPSLNFAGGISGLSDSQYSYNRTQNSTASYNSFWNRGRHNVTFGGDFRYYQLNLYSQQDARGTFTFTGATTGSDFAGFLLGTPDTSSIAFGNADKYYRQKFYSAFVTDDWRLSGALTLNLGARWEYEGPSSELQGRLVNLQVAKDFSTTAPVIGNGLIHADKFGIQPRVSFAWRPIAASSLIVRGGYGIYRNTNVYQAIATQMAQQSPLSKTLSVQNSAATPLTLANGFGGTGTQNTFAIDPNFRVGFAHNWQLSIQRDLPYSLQMTAMYLGSKGSRLSQEFLPNTFPTGAVGPSGYAYLQSHGSSNRNAGQIQLRRRLRNGFTASTQYTYSKALDNAPLMGGGIVTANQGGQSIAQNWLDLDAERARSSFDKRHEFTVQTQYTTGVGIRGGALLSGWRGLLFKEWTMTSNLTIGSGTPLTPVYFATVQGTGVTGNLRPDATGVSVKDAPAGFFLNPAAFRVPTAGQWGNAGRNSITGPGQFSLNASMTRSFPLRDRYNVDLNVNATNVLNHVTFRNWNTTINNAQFGLPGSGSANPMRSIQTSVRLRF